MRAVKGVILAQQFALGRLVKWVAALGAIPAFGVVAAFGIAPTTLDEKVGVARVVQEIALPEPVALDDESETHFVREDRVERGDTLAALLAKLNVDDPEAVAYLRQAKEARPFARMRTGRTVRAETSPDGELMHLSYLTPSGTLLQLERQGEKFKVSEEPADLDLRPLELECHRQARRKSRRSQCTTRKTNGVSIVAMMACATARRATTNQPGHA